MKKTLELISKLEPIVGPCAMQPALIFPGTELERLARERGILPADFSWCAPYECELNRKLGQLLNVPLWLDALTADELIALHEEKRLKSYALQAASLSVVDIVSKVARALRGNELSIWRLPKVCVFC